MWWWGWWGWKRDNGGGVTPKAEKGLPTRIAQSYLEHQLETAMAAPQGAEMGHVPVDDLPLCRQHALAVDRYRQVGVRVEEVHRA